uniref:Uncharacterized protein n=1 Tax=Stomoxys calcitrans TaxID=35570 RepID=A0A1I8NM57_STOCA
MQDDEGTQFHDATTNGACLGKDHRSWDETISAISCFLRNSFHESISSSPYHAVFGMDMITHASSYPLLLSLNLLNEPFSLSKDDRMQLCRRNLRHRIREPHERNRRQNDLRSRPQTFQNFSAKLSPMFINARVREKSGNYYYILENLQGKFDGTYHAKDIRP